MSIYLQVSKYCQEMPKATFLFNFSSCRSNLFQSRKSSKKFANITWKWSQWAQHLTLKKDTNVSTNVWRAWDSPEAVTWFVCYFQLFGGIFDVAKMYANWLASGETRGSIIFDAVLLFYCWQFDEASSNYSHPLGCPLKCCKSVKFNRNFHDIRQYPSTIDTSEMTT